MSNRVKLSGILVLLIAAIVCLAACSAGSQAVSNQAASSNASQATQTSKKEHIIGVAVYNTGDDEVIMFKDYLVNYIAESCFEDMKFVYSDSIRSEEDMLAFIDKIAEMGGEGIMSFTSIDLAAEVERCSNHGMYHIMASGTVSDEDFAAVAGNKYFLGCIGPGVEMEYGAGADMTQSFVTENAGNRYFVMSGGASLGNEMHYQRTMGILDAIETGYGVDLGDTKELAGSSENTTVTVGDVAVTVSPGYVSREGMKEQVEDAFAASECDVVLSVLPVSPIIGTLSKSPAKIAQIDCYSQDNQLLFEEGRLNYLAGKYGSLVGPSAAAMYNAVTGHASEFRDGGKAFRITQNIWSSPNEADFNEKYEFASNVTTPAYNYEDLHSVCPEFTQGATFDDFKALAAASSFEDGKNRRTLS